MSVSSQKHQKFKVSGDTSEQIAGGIFYRVRKLKRRIRSMWVREPKPFPAPLPVLYKHSITFHFKCKLLLPRQIKIDLFALTCIVIFSSNNTMQNWHRVS